MSTVRQIPSFDSINDTTQILVYQRSMTGKISAYDAAEYFNKIITDAAIKVDLTTNKVTLTLGNGQVIEGPVIV